MTSSLLPLLFRFNPVTVANEAAMLAIVGATEGTIAFRTDLGVSFICGTGDPTHLGSWTEMSFPDVPIPTLDAIPAAVADVDLHSHKLKNVADAGAATDALNRETGDGRYDAIGAAAAAQAASAQGLAPTAVKTGAYTAAAGDLVPVDVSGGNVTITLPTAPADKTRIGVKVVKVDGSHANSCSIARGGTDVFNIAAGATSLTLSALFQGVLLQYKTSSGIWYVSTADTPLATPLGAAKLGADGTLTGTGGSGLPASVVTTCPPPTGVAATDTANIIAAAASGGTVLLHDGTYLLTGTSPIVTGIPAGTTFKSIGGRTTIDLSAVTAAGGKKIAFRAQGSLGTKFSLTDNATARAYSATISAANAVTLAAAGATVGSWVMVLTQGANYYPYAAANINRGEIKRIRSINTSTGVVSFDEALYDTYTTANSSQLALVSPVTGLAWEGITFVGSNVENAGEEPIQLIFCDDVRVRDCHFNAVDLIGLELTCVTNAKVEACDGRGTLYDGVSGTDFYMIAMFNATQWVEISDCNGDQFRHLSVTAGYSDSGAGSTFQVGQPRFIAQDNCGMKNAMADSTGRSYAFEHHGVGEEIVWSNCWADSCDTGFVIKGGGHISITNFRVTNWYSAVMDFYPDATDLRSILIDGVTFGPPTTEGGATNPCVVRWRTATSCVVDDVVIRDILGDADLSVVRGLYATSTGISGINFEMADWNIRHSGTNALGTVDAVMHCGALADLRLKRIKAYNAQSLVYGTGNNNVAEGCELENSSAATAGIGIRWAGTGCKTHRSTIRAYIPVQYDLGSTGQCNRNALWSDGGAGTNGINDLTSGAVIEKDYNSYSTDGATWAATGFTAGDVAGTTVSTWGGQTKATVVGGSAPKAHAASHGTAGSDRLRASDLGEFWAVRRSSELSTMPRMLATASAALVTGFVYGGYAIEGVGQTYSKLRFCTGNGTPSYTALRLGIADASGNALLSTDDLAGTVTTAGTVYDNIPFSAAATQATVLGTAYFLCIGWAGTTLAVAGIAGRTGTMFGAIGIGPALQRGASSYSSGALPNLASIGNLAVIPWIEAIV